MKQATDAWARGDHGARDADELWPPDAAGERHASALGIVGVDRR
jgi:hypothetical protein